METKEIFIAKKILKLNEEDVQWHDYQTGKAETLYYKKNINKFIV